MTQIDQEHALRTPTVPAELRHTRTGPVEIGRHCLLLPNVVVMPGVKVGEITVVGAGGVVSQRLEPCAVYDGSPPQKTGARNATQVLACELRYYQKFLDDAAREPYRRRIAGLQEFFARPG